MRFIASGACPQVAASAADGAGRDATSRQPWLSRAHRQPTTATSATSAAAEITPSDFALSPPGSWLRRAGRRRGGRGGGVLASLSFVDGVGSAVLPAPQASLEAPHASAAVVSQPTLPQQQRPTHDAGAADGRGGAEAKAGGLLELPYGVMKGSSLLHYVWDGKEVYAIDEDTLRSGNHVGDAGSMIRRAVISWQDRIYKAFVPNTKDVTDDYWEWIKWRLTQRFFSSVLQNLSTQSMLMALGLGAKKSIAAGAAINWLLKDGVGRIARMTVATNFCQSFDSDLKRIRYITSMIFEGTILCEFLTPFAPQHFLALASVANVGKAIALSAFVAVQPAFHRAMCSGGNLADIAAKNQAQHMLVDMIALGVSAAVMFSVRHNDRLRMVLPLAAYPLLASADMWTIYKEIKAIELKVLNRERAEMVADRWLSSSRVVPSASEISQEERLLLPQDTCGGFLPLRITSVDKLIRRPEDVDQLQRYRSEMYMMLLQIPQQQVRLGAPSGSTSGRGAAVLNRSLWQWPQPQPQLLMCLSEDASPKDFFKAVLEAAHLRHSLRDVLRGKLATAASPTHGRDAAAMRGDQLWASAGSLLTDRDLDQCVANAQAQAQVDLPSFLSGMRARGWVTKMFLLSTSEKTHYVSLCGKRHE